MILVFPEAFLAKLTKPTSRGKFDDTTYAASGLSVTVFSLLFAILVFVNLATNFGGNNEFFSDSILSSYQVFFLCLFLFVVLFVKTLFFTGRSYFDFLSECTLREKKETTLFDNEGEQNVSEAIIIMFPKYQYQKEEDDKEYEISTKETITNSKVDRFKGRKGKIILKKGKAESRKNVNNISVEKIYANDDVEKFSQKARYRIKKVELLKETAVFTLWNIEYKKESRQLLVTVEGNIAEEVLEELKSKATIQEELDSLLK